MMKIVVLITPQLENLKFKMDASAEKMTKRVKVLVTKPDDEFNP